MNALTGIRNMLDDNPIVGAPRQGSRRFWTGREEKIMREIYPAGGVPACLPLLPGRSASSIYNRAGSMGLRRPGRQGRVEDRQRWSTSEHIDALIRRTYAQDTSRNAIQRLARSVGRPRWWVSKRAMQLGLVTPRFRQPAWTEVETALIAEQAHRHPRTLQLLLARHGFRRTETAITVKLKRLGADRTDPDHFTATALASVMGVDAKTVSAWIAKGWLRAARRGTDRVAAQGGDQWWIHRRDVRAFIVANTAAVDIRKVEKSLVRRSPGGEGAVRASASFALRWGGDGRALSHLWSARGRVCFR